LWLLTNERLSESAARASIDRHGIKNRMFGTTRRISRIFEIMSAVAFNGSSIFNRYGKIPFSSLMQDNRWLC